VITIFHKEPGCSAHKFGRVGTNGVSNPNARPEGLKPLLCVYDRWITVIRACIGSCFEDITHLDDPNVFPIEMLIHCGAELGARVARVDEALTFKVIVTQFLGNEGYKAEFIVLYIGDWLIIAAADSHADDIAHIRFGVDYAFPSLIDEVHDLSELHRLAPASLLTNLARCLSGHTTFS